METTAVNLREVRSMQIIAIDSHSRPRPEDYEPKYSHLKPRSYTDAKGNTRHPFNKRILSVSTAVEFRLEF